MRKSILTILMIFLVSVGMKAQAILDSNGKATMYANLAEAVDAAVDGDIIFLVGRYYDACDIKKRLYIRGIGLNTIIHGDITLSIPGNQKLDKPVMEGLYVSGTIRVNKGAENMVFRKVQCNKMKLDAQLDGGVIDRCHITDSLYLPLSGKDFYVRNTKIYNLSAMDKSNVKATFVNCNIYMTDYTNIISTFVNCLLYKNDVTATYNTFIGCATQYFSSNNSYTINHYWYGNNGGERPELLDNNCESPAMSWFKQNGWTGSMKGSDKTDRGVYGGVNPFDPYYAPKGFPVITSSNLNVDQVNGVMNYHTEGASSSGN